MPEPFGGKKVDFSGRKETAENVFGKEDIGPSEMTKKLWEYVKGKGLMK